MFKCNLFQLRNHILYLVENYQTLVIIGETGCGKSTQIPQVSVLFRLVKSGHPSGDFTQNIEQNQGKTQNVRM